MGDYFIGLGQSIIDGLGSVLESLVELLPASPFTLIDNSPVASFMGYLNWMLPIDSIIAVLEVWVAAVLIYYMYVVILRWVKAVQ